MWDGQYYVYILASHSRRLYVGMTVDPRRRLAQHRGKVFRGHTSLYRIHRLVYIEQAGDRRTAFARERALKRWCRAKKVALIEAANPWWDDLGAAWPQPSGRGRSAMPAPTAAVE